MITTHIIVAGAARAAQWYTTVLGAEERSRITLPDGRLIHLELWFGPSAMMVADEFPEQGALSPATTGCTSAVLYLQTSDVDAVWARAVGGGASVARPLADTFWGEREGQIVGPVLPNGRAGSAAPALGEASHVRPLLLEQRLLLAFGEQRVYPPRAAVPDHMVIGEDQAVLRLGDPAHALRRGLVEFRLPPHDVGLGPQNPRGRFFDSRVSRGNLRLDHLPQSRLVTFFRYRDAPAAKRAWWLVAEPADVDLCLTDPGFEPTRTFRMSERGAWVVVR